MMHAFFEPGDWFAPKRYGYGAGLPITWQGWVVSAAYVAALAGAGLMLDRTGDLVDNLMVAAGMAVLTLVYLVIAARRTEGGWRWRWGRD